MKKKILNVILVMFMMLSISIMPIIGCVTDNIIVKEIVSGLEYDNIGYFHNGLAAVLKDGKWGYIDKTGKLVISLIHDTIDYIGTDPLNLYIASFTEDNGLGVIEKDGKYAFSNGVEVVSDFYDYAYPEFSAGLTTVQKDGKWGSIDKTGKIIIPFIYDDIYGFIDGMANISKDGKWGFIDNTGKIAVPFVYEQAKYFSEGLASVSKDGKSGFIDKTGKIIIPFIYDSYYSYYLDHFIEGLAPVQKDGKIGYIDKNGEAVTSFIYYVANYFNEGLSAVQYEDGKWGILEIQN